MVSAQAEEKVGHLVISLFKTEIRSGRTFRRPSQQLIFEGSAILYNVFLYGRRQNIYNHAFLVGAGLKYVAFLMA